MRRKKFEPLSECAKGLEISRNQWWKPSYWALTNGSKRQTYAIWHKVDQWILQAALKWSPHKRFKSTQTNMRVGPKGNQRARTHNDKRLFRRKYMFFPRKGAMKWLKKNEIKTSNANLRYCSQRRGNDLPLTYQEVSFFGNSGRKYILREPTIKYYIKLASPSIVLVLACTWEKHWL